MKLKHYLKNLTSLALILSCCLYYGCSERPSALLETTSVEKDFIKSFTETTKIGYQLDLATNISGKTFWIYIATQKDILTLSPASSTGGVTPEKLIKFLEIKCNYLDDSMFALDYIFLKYSDEERKQEKDIFEQAISGAGISLYQDFTDSTIEILQKTYASIGDIIDKVENLNFFAIALANIKKGTKVTFVIHRVDMEQFLMGMLPSDEFYNRMIIKTEGAKEIINDRYGLHLEYNDISLVNFLREQIVNNARSTISEFEHYEPEKIKQIDELDDILLKSVYEVVTKYEFDDFLFVEIENIVSNKKLSLSKSKLISRYSQAMAPASLEEYNF